MKIALRNKSLSILHRSSHIGEYLLDVSVLEAINTLRNMRRLKPDPVEPEKVHSILEAAGKAPSGGNSQPWEFIIVTEPSVKKRVR